MTKPMKRKLAFFITSLLSKIPSKGRMINGFGLLEAAIALIVMGMIGATLLSSLRVYMAFKKEVEQKNQWKETIQRQEVILKAIGAYITRYYHLPLPTVQVKNKEFIGLVPTEKLGISAKYQKDAFGHFFTYAVNPALSQDKAHFKGLNNKNLQVDASAHYFCQSPLGEGLTITSEKGHASTAALVIISHGPKGEGAFIEGKISVFRTKVTGENTNDDALFFAPSSPSKACDDIIEWVTRETLVALYTGTVCAYHPMPLFKKSSAPKHSMTPSSLPEATYFPDDERSTP